MSASSFNNVSYNNYSRPAVQYSNNSAAMQPQNSYQQTTESHRSQHHISKGKSYALTAARGFLLGAVLDGGLQLLNPHIKKISADPAEKAAIDLARKNGLFKVKPARMAVWGAIWAAMDVGLRLISDRD